MATTTVSKNYGELKPAEIIPGTELVDLDSDQASCNEGEEDNDSEYTLTIATYTHIGTHSLIAHRPHTSDTLILHTVHTQSHCPIANTCTYPHI